MRRIRKGVPPPHKGKKIKYPVGRRGFKLERLPLHVQAATFRALGQGETYVDISAKLRKQRYSLTAGSIGRYWRKVWKKTHKKLQEAYLIKEHLKEALRGKRKSSNAAMAEELLYTMIVKKLDELEQEPPMPMLKEAREQAKVAGEEEETPPSEKASPVLQAREVRRRWRQLYGLEEDAEEEDEEKTR